MKDFMIIIWGLIIGLALIFLGLGLVYGELLMIRITIPIIAVGILTIMVLVEDD